MNRERQPDLKLTTDRKIRWLFFLSLPCGKCSCVRSPTVGVLSTVMSCFVPVWNTFRLSPFAPRFRVFVMSRMCYFMCIGLEEYATPPTFA